MQRQRGLGESWLYEEWMQKEGIPIYEGAAGIEDITELPRRPWARLGGKGSFIQLEATKASGKLLYVAEIPAGGALETEKHLYDELIYILQGRGLTEVWQEGQPKQTFEWGEGSLFAMPLNARHRLVNGGRQPVLYFAVTNAPNVMETFRNTDFIFNCDYKFTDRYSGQADYFLASEKRYTEGAAKQGIWETNFVPDVRTAFLDNLFQKVESGQLTQFRMAAWTTVHSSEWPVGMYHKAHYHAAGPVLLGQKSVGFVLLWHKQYGIHPYQDGHGDKVIKMDWKKNSIYSPQSEVFHQHFNTGKEAARHLAVTGGGIRFGGPRRQAEQAVYVSVRDGGWLIDYEDEDPEIRRMLQEDLRKNGVKFAMKPVVYRTDPFKFAF